MELRGKHVLLPNRRGKAFAVSCAGRHDRGVSRFREKAVHEVNVAAAWNAAQDRTIRSNHLDLVPANLRDLQARFPGKPNNLSLEYSQSRRAAIEFLALLEQRLVTDANPEKPPARFDEIAARLEQVLLLQRVQAIVECPNSRQHDRARVLHLGRARGEAHIRFEIAQRFVHAPEIAGAVIDQSNHRRSIRRNAAELQPNTPKHSLSSIGWRRGL